MGNHDHTTLRGAAGRRHPAARAIALVLAATALAAVAAGLGAASAPAQATATWCGTPTAADEPDAVSAFQIHVLFAVPADGADAFADRASQIVSDVASIESWWQYQDPARDLRLDLLAGGCDTTTGRLDLSSVRLPREGAYYADPTAGFQRITADVAALGFSSPDKKYLVYYDGPVRLPSVCGTSPRGPARAGATSVVYLQSFCGDDLGAGGKAAATAVHELLHNLGALPRLHPCAGSRAHACDIAGDILYPTVEQGAALVSLRLDVDRDDYYGLGGGAPDWLDVRDSPFLERLPVPAAVPSPPPPRNVWATSTGARVRLSWAPVNSTPGLLFRVYRDGRLLTENAGATVADTATAGSTVVYTLRTADPNGLLGQTVTIRVLVGTGVVDERGAVVRDTIPPPRVTGMRAAKTPKAVVLRWDPVADPGDLAGYRVFRDGRPLGRVQRATSLTVSRLRATATWSVAAVDTAGNVGPQSRPVRVR